MNANQILVAVLLLLPLCANAELVSTAEQTREWTEKHPPQGLTISNLDRYVDYKRNGKIVFRTVKRTVTIKAKPNQQVAKANKHIIEFVADGNVFGSIGLDKAAAQSLTVTSGAAVQFSTGPSGKEKRFFHVCVPKHDYYEYLVVNGADIDPPVGTAESYAAAKRAFIEMTEKGYIHPLGKEQLLDAEKPR